MKPFQLSNYAGTMASRSPGKCQIRLPGTGESVQIKHFTGSSAWKWEQSSGNLRCVPVGRRPAPLGGVGTLHPAPGFVWETAWALPLHAGAEVWVDGQTDGVTRGLSLQHVLPRSVQVILQMAGCSMLGKTPVSRLSPGQLPRYQAPLL